MLFIPERRSSLQADVPGAARRQPEVTDAVPNWSTALNQFATLFVGRVPVGGLNSKSLKQIVYNFPF
jgi:hypothetical protein